MKAEQLYAVCERGHGNSAFNINYFIIISYNLSSLIHYVVNVQKHRKLQKLRNINVFFFVTSVIKPLIIRHCLLLC